jgi:hypothetical protein
MGPNPALAASMKRILTAFMAALLTIAISACDADESADGTPNPSTGESGAPLNDDAVGPDETQVEASGG